MLHDAQQVLEAHFAALEMFASGLTAFSAFCASEDRHVLPRALAMMTSPSDGGTFIFDVFDALWTEQTPAAIAALVSRESRLRLFSAALRTQPGRLLARATCRDSAWDQIHAVRFDLPAFPERVASYPQPLRWSIDWEPKNKVAVVLGSEWLPRWTNVFRAKKI